MPSQVTTLNLLTAAMVSNNLTRWRSAVGSDIIEWKFDPVITSHLMNKRDFAMLLAFSRTGILVGIVARCLRNANEVSIIAKCGTDHVLPADKDKIPDRMA